MPTVASEGYLKFIINTRETEFEPPHVHVWIGNEDLCHIELNGTIFYGGASHGHEKTDFGSIFSEHWSYQKRVGQDSSKVE